MDSLITLQVGTIIDANYLFTESDSRKSVLFNPTNISISACEKVNMKNHPQPSASKFEFKLEHIRFQGIKMRQLDDQFYTNVRKTSSSALIEPFKTSFTAESLITDPRQCGATDRPTLTVDSAARPTDRQIIPSKFRVKKIISSKFMIFFLKPVQFVSFCSCPSSNRYI